MNAILKIHVKISWYKSWLPCASLKWPAWQYTVCKFEPNPFLTLFFCTVKTKISETLIVSPYANYINNIWSTYDFYFLNTYLHLLFLDFSCNFIHHLDERTNNLLELWHLCKRLLTLVKIVTTSNLILVIGVICQDFAEYLTWLRLAYITWWIYFLVDILHWTSDSFHFSLRNSSAFRGW